MPAGRRLLAVLAELAEYTALGFLDLPRLG